MEKESILFSPIKIHGLNLFNRITMTPLYLGYANEGGTVSELILEHYRKMAQSGASLIVVENAAVSEVGMGSPFTLRVDDDSYIPGLKRLAEVIHSEVPLPFSR
jgi:2,4-dienoyl-CoA reductase (NADPH2)